MKILIINYEYPPLGGGGGVATKQMAEELAQRHEVHVLTSTHEGGNREEELSGVRVHRVHVGGRKELPTATLQSMMAFLPKALVLGWRLCRNTEFDVLNAQFVVPSGIPARILAGYFKIPFVVSFIGGDLYDPTKGISPHRHWYFRVLIRWIVAGAKICTAISEDTKRRAQGLHGITKNIVVTHLGYIPSTVAPTSRTELSLPSDSLVAVTIGRLIPRKGYEVLLDAWKQIPNTHLIIMGEGPLRAELSKIISESGLRDRVRLTGYLSEEKKQQMLAQADLYVAAAEHEGFGIVYLEAMAAGLPLVVMNEGGHTDFLRQHVNAILVEPGDSEKFARSVSVLLGDADMRRKMGERNTLDARNFTVERVTQKFEEVLLKARNL